MEATPQIIPNDIPNGPVPRTRLEETLRCIEGHLAGKTILFGQSSEATLARYNAMTAALQGNRMDLITTLAALPEKYSTFLRYTDPSTRKNLLHLAADFGSLEAVRFFVEQGIDPNSEAEDKITPFIMACMKNHLPVARFLHEQDPKAIDHVLTSGANALFVAVTAGHTEIVRWLIDHTRINCLLQRSNGACVLHAAADLGHSEILELLLNPCRAILTVKATGATVLHYACRKGHLGNVKALFYAVTQALRHNSMEIDAFINSRSEGGDTALFIATRSNNIDIVRWLLTYTRADLSIVAYNKYSPLLHACYTTQNEMVKLLLEWRRQGEPKDGLRSYFNACCCCDNIDAAKMLHAIDDQVHLGQGKTFTPLHSAAQTGSLRIIKWLVKELHIPVDLHLKNLDAPPPENWPLKGVTALYVACRYGMVTTVKLLVENGADPNAYKSNGISPLYVACAFQKVEVVVYLLSLGDAVNVDQARVGNVAPLHIAASVGNLAIVQLLCQRGCKMSLMSNKASALHAACVKDHVHVVRWLLLKTMINIFAVSNGGETALAAAFRFNAVRCVLVLGVYSLAGLDTSRTRDKQRLFSKLYGPRYNVNPALNAGMRGDMRLWFDRIAVLSPIQIAILCNYYGDAYYLVSMGIASPLVWHTGISPSEMLKNQETTLAKQKISVIMGNAQKLMWESYLLAAVQKCILPWAPCRSQSSFGPRFNNAVLTILTLAERLATMHTLPGLPLELWYLVMSFLTSTYYAEPFIAKIASMPHETISVFKPSFHSFESGRRLVNFF